MIHLGGILVSSLIQNNIYMMNEISTAFQSSVRSKEILSPLRMFSHLKLRIRI